MGRSIQKIDGFVWISVYLVVSDGFHRFLGQEVLRPVATCGGLWGRNGAPHDKKSPGPRGLDPAVLESWRLGGLEVVCLAGWLLM